MVRLLVSAFFLFFAGAALAAGGKEEYERAVKYSKAGEYEAALPFFKKAYELSGKRPSTIVALAQCERSLKLWDDAIAHFNEYLAVKPTPKDAKKIRETIALLVELKAAEPKKAPPVKVVEQPPPPPPKKIEPKLPEPQPQPALIAVSTPPAPKEEDEGLLESPVFWVITGAVVLAAGGVAAGLALRGEAEPYGGTAGQVLHK